MNEIISKDCPLSVEIKGKTYCFKSLGLDKECTNCIKKVKNEQRCNIKRF